jgi:hypothetical protein
MRLNCNLHAEEGAQTGVKWQIAAFEREIPNGDGTIYA